MCEKHISKASKLKKPFQPMSEALLRHHHCRSFIMKLLYRSKKLQPQNNFRLRESLVLH